MSATRHQAQDDQTHFTAARSQGISPAPASAGMRRLFPSNTPLDGSKSIILGKGAFIPTNEFHPNQEMYFSRFQALCQALQEYAMTVSEREVWASYNGDGFGLSPSWWAFWQTVRIPELMVMIRLGVPLLTATILGNKVSIFPTRPRWCLNLPCIRGTNNVSLS